MSKTLFRESALRRLSSPEQLDQLLPVTSPRGWMSLGALLALIAVALTWAVFGRIPTTEAGPGIIRSATGQQPVVASGSGRLIEVKFKAGEVVKEGDIVALIDKQDLQDQLGDAQLELARLTEQHRRLTEFDQREQKLQDELAEVERRRLTQSKEFAAQRLLRLADRRKAVEKLIIDGMMTPVDLERIDEEVESVTSGLEETVLRLEQVDATAINNEFSRQREEFKRQTAAGEVQSRIAMVNGRLDRESRVVSPVAGRVIEVRAAVQTVVAMGDPILLIEPTGGEGHGLEAIVYVSASTGRRVTEGMPVMLLPSTIKREEYGSMLGTVLSVATSPTSKLAMTAELSDKGLVDKFSDEIGLPLELRIALTTDSDTPTGYKWTSRNGPPTPISAGTLCNAWVTVTRVRPIDLVIPYLSKSVDAN